MRRITLRQATQQDWPAIQRLHREHQAAQGTNYELPNLFGPAIAIALVGVLPSYASVGVIAAVALIALRLLQGLALGGEYGGAATYVGEHAPPGQRGMYTSWIQTTATLGLFLSLLVILLCRNWLGAEFDTWGWRIPFLVSIVLLAISVYIRMQLAESPVFLEMKEAGTRSKAPLTESFARWGNLRLVILALLGATAGQAVVWS